MKNEEFRQNFDVFRLPIFRNEAEMLEKILIRGNEEGVWNIRDPHIRAYSYIFAMFGLAETPDLDTEMMKQEIREITKLMLLLYFPLAPEHDLIDALNMLYATYKMELEHYPAENIAILGGSSGAAMTLWLMSYINQKGEGVPMPGKLALSSPGSALTAEERKRAEELIKTDLIMSTAALDNIFKGMVGGKKLPNELLYTSRGIYDGIKDVYLSYGGDEVAQSTAERLRSYGAKVTLEIAEGMYHTYAVMPLVKEAIPGHQRLVAYLTVK